MTIDRPSPADVQAERALLGGLLAEPGNLLDLLGRIEARDFYRPEHGALFDLLIAMVEARTPIDLISVVAEIGTQQRTADRYGGLGYVAELPDHCPSTVNLGRYAEIIADHSTARKLAAEGVDLVNAAYAREMPPGEVASEFVARLLELTSTTGHIRRHWSFADAVQAAEEHRVDVIQGAVAAKVATGFDSDRGLDDMLGGGVEPGELCVIAGPTSMGKTGLAIPIALEMARAGRRVLFAELETPHIPLVNRARSYLTRLPHRTFVGPYSAVEEQLVEDIDPNLGFEILDWPGASITQIGAEARRLWARGGLSALFIDYLQIMTHERERNELLSQSVGRTTKACKHLAMELKIPVFLLSQLNREYDKRQAPAKKAQQTNGPWWDAVALPQLSDLKESGSIEQDADIVLFPLNADRLGLPNKGDGAIVIAKQRNGPRGTVGCNWDAPCAAYRPYRHGGSW